jgi:hypothetical protein
MSGMKPSFAVVLGLSVLLSLCGCQSFESDWRAAPTSPADNLTGRWIGTWQNTNNTHSGPLRAVLWQRDTNRFDARFHAGWGKRSGSFRTKLRGHWQDGTFHFTGKQRIFLVPITTTGTARPDRLDSGYDSPLDRGSFKLHRE